MRGVVFDTGALLALERGTLRMRQRFEALVANSVVPKVPTPILAEWWRKGRREKERMAILRSLQQEPLSPYAAKLAGVAMGVVRGATIIDAIVMAAASVRSDIVFTSDPEDLERLREVFPDVLVVRV